MEGLRTPGRSLERMRAEFLGMVSHELRAPLASVKGCTATVLGNLLANASRHSPQPSPIQVGAELEGVHVAVWVADEGIGVSAEMLPRLFRKFVRTGDGGRGYEGLALGLAICKGLVEAHGGRIWAESGGAGQGGRVCTCDTLVGRLWGKGDARDVRLVHAFMKKLRHKLGDDAASPGYIFTVHRVGYRMAKPAQS